MPMAKDNNPPGRKSSDRKFSWLVANIDGQKLLLVDSSYPEKSAAEFFLRFRPNDDPYSNYEMGFAAFDVVTSTYKLVEEKSPGSFPVYVFYME